jgi:hypothetical protein
MTATALKLASQSSGKLIAASFGEYLRVRLRKALRRAH